MRGCTKLRFVGVKVTCLRGSEGKSTCRKRMVVVRNGTGRFSAAKILVDDLTGRTRTVSASTWGSPVELRVISASDARVVLIAVIPERAGPLRNTVTFAIPYEIVGSAKRDSSGMFAISISEPGVFVARKVSVWMREDLYREVEAAASLC